MSAQDPPNALLPVPLDAADPVRCRVDRLTAVANEEYDAAEAAFRTGLGHAIRCGGALTEVKPLVGHGNWGRWLRDNFLGSDRTARLYMRLYANRQVIADLPSIGEAVAALTEPRALPPGARPIQTPIDHGDLPPVVHIDGQLDFDGQVYRAPVAPDGHDADRAWLIENGATPAFADDMIAAGFRRRNNADDAAGGTR